MRLLALLTALLTIGACTAGETMRQIQPGQSRDAVIRAMGNPDGVSRSGNVETLTYANRLMSGWSWDRATYQVQLTDGNVTSYGPVDIRSRQSPVTPVVVMPIGR